MDYSLYKCIKPSSIPVSKLLGTHTIEFTYQDKEDIYMELDAFMQASWQGKLGIGPDDEVAEPKDITFDTNLVLHGVMHIMHVKPANIAYKGNGKHTADVTVKVICYYPE
jgi:hypothetical protein